MLDNPFSQRVNAIVQKTREMRRGVYHQHLYIVKEDGEPPLRLWALSCLIQDRADVLPSYQQFISQLKDKVRQLVFMPGFWLLFRIGVFVDWLVNHPYSFIGQRFWILESVSYTVLLITGLFVLRYDTFRPVCLYFSIQLFADSSSISYSSLTLP